MVVEITGCEACEGFAVQRVWGGRSGLDNIAFVELKFHFSCHILLCGCHKSLDCLSKRCEPFPFVYNLSQLIGKVFLYFVRRTVKNKLFKLLVCFHQDCSARCFINAAGFHSNNTVFYDIDDTNTVFATKTVEFCDDLGQFHLFPIQTLRNPFFKCHGDIFRLIRCLFRRHTEHKQIIVVRSQRRIFQFQSFVADVPEVPVAAVAVFCVERQVNTMLFAVFDFIFTGLHGPQISHSPRSDDLKVRSQGGNTKLKTDLVVSFSGCAVTDCYCVFFPCDLNELFRNSRTSHCCAEQIFVLIDSTGLYARHNVVFAELIHDIFNVELACAGHLCALFQSVQFFPLPTVNAAADDVVVKCFFQPRNDGCRIQAS